VPIPSARAQRTLEISAYDAGRKELKKGNFEQAQKLFMQADELAKSSNAQGRLRMAPLVALAETYRDLGKYKESEDLFKKVMSTAEQPPVDLVSLVEAANNLSLVYTTLSRYPEAEQLVLNAITVVEKYRGQKTPDLSLFLNNLARLYIVWGRFDDADKTLIKAEKVLNTAKKQQRWEYFYTLYNRANLFTERGNYAAAEPLYPTALAGIIENFGKDHEYVAAGLQSQAELHRKEGRYTLAEQELTRSREIRESTFAKDHPEIAIVWLKLAAVYKEQGRYDEAIAACQKATEIAQKKLDEKNPISAQCLYITSSIDYELGKYQEAEQTCRQAIAIDQGIFGDDHPQVARDMTQLANILAAEQKYDEAKKLLNQSLEISKAKLGDEHPDIAETIHSFALLYSAQNDLTQAEPMYRKSAELAEKELGPDHAKVARDKRDLAGVLITLQKFDQAQPLLLQALDADSKSFGEKSAPVASDLDLLAAVCAKQGNEQDAQKYLERAQSIESSLPGFASINKVAGQAPTMPARSENDRRVTDKWALVIGISNFKDPSIDLRYAAKDATDFRNFLVAKEHFQPDHVKLLTDANATRDKIISELGPSWLGKLAHKDDLVVIYVSSHGSSSLEDVGMNFLVAYDTDKNAPVSTGVPLQWLTKIIQENVHCDRNILFLDVCHSGSAIAGQTLLASRSVGNQTLSDSRDSGQRQLAASSIMQNATKELNTATSPNVLASAPPATSIAVAPATVTPPPPSTSVLSDSTATRPPMSSFYSPPGASKSFSATSTNQQTSLSALTTNPQSASSPATTAKAATQAGQKSLIRTPSATGQQQLALGSGQVILCSSLADQISWESKNYPNGVFTRRLIEALQCKGDDTSLSEAYKQLRQSVESEVLHDRGNLQTPQLSNKDWSGGDPFVGVIPSAPRSASTR
jgi:tetratricopeptide (TPR) repeat protein